MPFTVEHKQSDMATKTADNSTKASLFESLLSLYSFKITFADKPHVSRPQGKPA